VELGWFDMKKPNLTATTDKGVNFKGFQLYREDFSLLQLLNFTNIFSKAKLETRYFTRDT
jgi:hypothetical protein